MILLFLKGLWGKISFKLFLAIALSLLCYFTGKALVDYGDRRAMERVRNAPADTVRVIEYLTNTLRDTVFKTIPGVVVHDTIDLSLLTRRQLEEAVQPFSITQPVTVTDDKEKVGISFNMSLTARPLQHSVTGLKFSNIHSTYPKETITITKTVIEPYSPNFLDLFVESKIGGVFGTKGTAGYIQSGVDINIGAVQISGGIGAASQDKRVHGLWTVGLKVSTR